MSGISDLGALLREMKPRLIPGSFVYSTLAGVNNDYERLSPLMHFHEDEGLSVIVRRESAEEAGLEYSATWRCITLSVHSDLEAIGFLAEITRALAESEIPSNVVSAYFHDHIFVPESMANQALSILKALADSVPPC